jgi:hypothetical protein
MGLVSSMWIVLIRRSHSRIYRLLARENLGVLWCLTLHACVPRRLGAGGGVRQWVFWLCREQARFHPASCTFGAILKAQVPFAGGQR